MNTGKEAWENTFLACQTPPMTVANHNVGLIPVSDQVPIPYTAPGDSVIVSVDFTAPPLPGTVISEWKSVNDKGHTLFPDHKPLYCIVKVVTI